MKTMRLPETKAQDDRSGLWSLQLELLSMAESVLGPRDILKKIYQPKFTDEGPQLRNTPHLDGAFADLASAIGLLWFTKWLTRPFIYLTPSPVIPITLMKGSPSRFR